MITNHPVLRHLSLRPTLSALIYVGLVAILAVTALLLLADIVEKYGVRNDALETLAKLEKRSQASPKARVENSESHPPGSPFLESQTVTLARAALLQRVISAITSAGGNVLSSEIETQGSQAKDGYLRALAICELEQPALQQLLYDIEAGMPFLFVDQLVAQTATPSGDGKRMRILLGVSGLWPGAK